MALPPGTFGWVGSGFDCTDCGCTDPCNNCPPYETVSISGSSAATGERCSGSLPAHDGTHSVGPYAGDPCLLYLAYTRTICGPNLEGIDFYVEILKPPLATSSSVATAFPYATGFRLIFAIGYIVNYGTGPGHVFYEDFETCPTGSVLLNFYATFAGTVPITTSPPSSVTVNWP